MFENLHLIQCSFVLFFSKFVSIVLNLACFTVHTGFISLIECVHMCWSFLVIISHILIMTTFWIWCLHGLRETRKHMSQFTWGHRVSWISSTSDNCSEELNMFLWPQGQECPMKLYCRAAVKSGKNTVQLYCKKFGFRSSILVIGPNTQPKSCSFCKQYCDVLFI